jgi:hypothetical protein
VSTHLSVKSHCCLCVPHQVFFSFAVPSMSY